MGQTEEWYLTASVYSDIAIFIILTSSIIFMLIKLRLKVDATGVVTLTIFWFTALTKMISSIQVQTKGIIGMTAAITIISVQLVWCSLYYFTFEMRIIQSVLENQDSNKHISQQKKFKVQMCILILITMVFGIVYSIYRILELDYPIAFAENLNLISTFVAVSRTVKFLGDLYVHIVFIKVFKYLLQYRSFVQDQREYETAQPKKQLSRLIIVWVLFLFLISLWNACSTIMIAIFQHELGSDYLQSTEYELVLVLVRLVFPIKDFFIAMSLFWLYFQQGLKEKSQQNSSRSYGASLVDKDTLEINALLKSEDLQRIDKVRFNSMMRGMSVKNGKNEHKISQKQSVAGNELGFNHGNEKFDIKLDYDEDMEVDQFTPSSFGQTMLYNQQFRNFIFDNFIANPNTKLGNPVAGSEPLSIPY